MTVDEVRTCVEDGRTALIRASAMALIGDRYYFGFAGVGEDYKQAVHWYRLAFDHRYFDAELAFRVGEIYYSGEGGVPQDYGEAAHWFSMVGEQSHHKVAQFKLGIMHHEGLGIPKNYQQAARWFQMSADEGYPEAQFNLGVMYHRGEGVPQSFKEALKWYRLAAEWGIRSAQHNLGLMNFYGQGVPRDNVLAHMYFNLAARIGDETSRKFRDEVASRMTPAQVATAQRMAFAWKPREKTALELLNEVRKYPVPNRKSFSEEIQRLEGDWDESIDKKPQP